MPGPYRIPFTSPGSVHSNFDNAFGVETDAVASGAIAIKEGVVNLSYAGAAAFTLAAPTAGLPSAGGDDGRYLTFMDTGGHAHTITTPANAINGNKHIATWGGTVASFLTFVALGGIWYLEASSGVTLS